MSAWGRGRGQSLCVKNIGRNLKNERQEWPAVRRPPRSPDTVASGTPETPGGGEQRAPRPRDSVRQHLPSAATPQTQRRTRRRHQSLTGPLVRDADAPDPESAPAGGRCSGPQDAARWRRAPRGARARRPGRQCPRELRISRARRPRSHQASGWSQDWNGLYSTPGAVPSSVTVCGHASRMGVPHCPPAPLRGSVPAPLLLPDHKPVQRKPSTDS